MKIRMAKSGAIGQEETVKKGEVKARLSNLLGPLSEGGLKLGDKGSRNREASREESDHVSAVLWGGGRDPLKALLYSLREKGKRRYQKCHGGRGRKQHKILVGTGAGGRGRLATFLKGGGQQESVDRVTMQRWVDHSWGGGARLGKLLSSQRKRAN